jgi:hypothetical protein
MASTTPNEPPIGTAAPADAADALAVAEAAHLAARRAAPIGPRRPGRDPVDSPQGVRPPVQRTPARRPRTRRAPLPLAAAVAATWAALLTYLPVALVLGLARLAEGAGSASATARLGLAGWLLGHGVPLGTAAGPLGLVPLALTGFALWRAARAGVHVTRAVGARRTGSLRRAFSVAVAVGIAYGLLGALAAALVDDPGLRVSAVRAGLTLAGFGVVAGAAGALRATGAMRTLARRLPAVLRHALRTGVVAAALVLAAGAAAAGTAIALRGGDASDMVAAYRTGTAGQAGVTLICLAYAPNAAVWAAAYLIGPGFAVGGDTAVRATEVSTGALPAVPVFAGLPDAPLDGPATLLLGVPLAAGMVAGWLLARRRLRAAAARPHATVRWAGLLAGAGIAGPVAGVLLGLAAMASGGPLGGGRLAEFGPVWWQMGAVASGVIALGALIGAAAKRAFMGGRATP